MTSGVERARRERGRGLQRPPAHRRRAAQVQVRSVEVEGAQFRLVGANGAPVPQEALPGTLHTIGDSLGVQAPADEPAYEFEAGFGPLGAVCVRHVRVEENATLAGVEASNPRLVGPVGEICEEAFARALGAILFVRSPP
jgi:hypothetical protein